MVDKILALETIKAGKERIRRGESADIDVGTPGLPENPVKQTERMESDAKIRLAGTLTERPEYGRYAASPAHSPAPHRKRHLI